MRYLAIARLRLLTTTRAANPLFAVTIAAAAAPALFVSFLPDEAFRVSADYYLGLFAFAALGTWVLHTLLLALACNAFGNDTLIKSGLTAGETPGGADLIDTAPISLGSRFWGETIGIFSAAMTIHLCALPLLALIVALSPLPTRMFIGAETATIVLVFLASAGGAWKRRAPRTKWSGTRSARSGFLFGLLLLMIVRKMTDWVAFRDSLALIVNDPSPRIWSEATKAINNPLLLVVTLTLLYSGYLAYYYWSSVRIARR